MMPLAVMGAAQQAIYFFADDEWRDEMEAFERADHAAPFGRERS